MRNSVLDVVIDGGYSIGGEADWLTFYWDISTDQTAPGPVTPSTLLRWYIEANAKLPATRAPVMRYDLLAAEAIEDNPAFRAWLDAKAVAHAVH